MARDEVLTQGDPALAAIAQLSDKFDEFRSMMEQRWRDTVLMHTTTTYNERVRVYNSGAPGAFQVVKKETLPSTPQHAPMGAKPPVALWPRNKTALFKMKATEIDQLADFYEEDFGSGSTGEELIDRQQLVALFMGVPW